jgi:hypothetical protein
MTMDSLETTERRLREAVLHRNFDEVAAATNEYRRAFDREWRNMPPAQRRQSALPMEADRLMRWAIGRLQALRASLAARRRASGAASYYLTAGHIRRNRTWGAAG